MANLSTLSDDELWRGMAANGEAMNALVKYQVDLEKAKNPTDPAARTELMISNVRIVAKLRKEYNEYFAELQRRYPE